MYKAEMKKGSPGVYNAETGLSEPARKTEPGEPYEYDSLYRIRRSQKERQLLCESRRRADPRGRQAGGDAGGVMRVGAKARSAVARGDGGDAVQRLDLRHVAAVCRAAADGASGADESHRSLEEEDRRARRAHDRRPGALRFAAGLLCGAGRDAGPAATVTLPQSGGEGGGAHAEQDWRAADGSGRAIPKTALAWPTVFQRAAGQLGRSATLGQRSAAVEPRSAGDVRSDAAAVIEKITSTSLPGGARETAGKHSWRRAGDGAHLGAGNSRATTLPLTESRGELLRINRSPAVFGRQSAARAYLQTAQCALTDRADRGREIGAPLEPTVGGAARPRAGTRPSQPRHLGGGPQARRVFIGGGQIRSAVSAALLRENRRPDRESGLALCSELTDDLACRRFASDPPAVSRPSGDCTREEFLLMCPIVCFETG